MIMKKNTKIILSAVITVVVVGIAVVVTHQNKKVKPVVAGAESKQSPAVVDTPEIAALKQQIAADPSNESSQVKLGNDYFQAGRYNESEQEFRNILATDQNSEGALLGLGNVLRYRGRYEESETAFKKAVELDPKNSENYVELGKLYRNWNKWDEVEASLKMAAQLDPKNDLIYSYGLGYLYRDEGK